MRVCKIVHYKFQDQTHQFSVEEKLSGFLHRQFNGIRCRLIKFMTSNSNLTQFSTFFRPYTILLLTHLHRHRMICLSIETHFSIILTRFLPHVQPHQHSFGQLVFIPFLPHHCQKFAFLFFLSQCKLLKSKYLKTFISRFSVSI